MKFHWGHYCIFTAIVLTFLQTYIALNPLLDKAFTPIQVYNRPVYLTHNYVEMVGFFLYGIGFSKSLQRYTKYIEATMWLTLFLYPLYNAIRLSSSLLIALLGISSSLLLAWPLPFGFYLYKFYHKRIPKQCISLSRTV